MDYVIRESFYKGTILQRNYRKMTMLWSFSYNSSVKFHGKKYLGATCYIQFHVIVRFVIKGLQNTGFPHALEIMSW